MALFGFETGDFFGGNFFGVVASPGNCGENGGDIFCIRRISADAGAFMREIHRSTLDAGNPLNGFGDVARAVIACHAADAQFSCGWRGHFRMNILPRRTRFGEFPFQRVVSCLERSAAVSETSRSSFNALRLTLHAQPRSAKLQTRTLPFQRATRIIFMRRCHSRKFGCDFGNW